MGQAESFVNSAPGSRVEVYNFRDGILELDASVQDPSVLAMLEEMERSCAEFQFLGNYAEV